NVPVVATSISTVLTSSPRWIFLVALCAGVACSGQIGEVAGGANRGNPATGGGPYPPGSDGGYVVPPDAQTGMASPDGQAGPATVGETPLRRLGKTELHNTLRDLFPTL